MSCNGCTKTFTILRREKGCPTCGFSYCSACLQKTFDPKLRKEVKVCPRCKRESESAEPNTKIEPPKAYLKRLEKALGHHSNLESDDLSSLKRGLSSTDQAIAERLEKLKSNRNDSSNVQKNGSKGNQDIEERLNKLTGINEAKKISDADIEARLARLRGEPQSLPTTSTSLPPVDTRSDEEKTRDLIKQYMEEVDLDSKNKQDFDARIDDIQVRLLALQGHRTDTPKENKLDENKTENEEEMVKRIIAELKAKAELESEQVEQEIAPQGEEELPWCEICNEDAAVRCRGCHYLYCMRCFNEHKDDDDDCNSYDVFKKK